MLFRVMGSRSAFDEKPPLAAVWRAKEGVMKYWEIIADNLSKAGWSWGCVSAEDSQLESARDCYVFATDETDY
jgi:hypothetical protein